MEQSADHPEDDLRPEYDLRQLRPVPEEKRRRRLDKLATTSAFPSERSHDTRMRLSPEESRAFIDRMGTSLMPLFGRCVVPIYRERKGEPVQWGTGTLFRVADYSFLVSACHVTDLVRHEGIQLYITDTPPGSPGIALEGKLHSEANLDVSVWELTPRVVAELPNRQFLTIHHADRADLRVTRGWYYIHGYPNCWTDPRPYEKEITVKGFTYGAILYEGDTSTFDGYNPELHVLLTVPKDKNIDSKGAETELPESLKGISGCSIWQAYYEGLPSRTWTVDDAVVVAVQTGAYQKGTVVRGTRWWLIEKILATNYKDLEGPLSLVTPYLRKPTS